MSDSKKDKYNDISPSDTEIKKLLESFQLGEIKNTKKLAQSFTKRFPSNDLGWKALGVILSFTGNFKEAIRANYKALKIKPLDYESHFNLGLNLQKLAKFKEAEISFKKAIEIKPDYFEAYNNLTTNQEKIGRLNEAEISCKKVIEIKPDYPEAYNKLGNILCDLGRLNEAEISFKKAIEIKPDYFEAYNNLGTVYEELGKLDKATLNYKRAIYLKKDNAEAYYNLGNICMKLGKFKEAIEFYDKSLLINPKHELARSVKLYQHAKICDWDTIKNNKEAIKKLGTSEIGINPFNFFSLDDSPEKHYLRSKLYIQKKFTPKEIIFPKTQTMPERLNIGYFGCDFYNHPVMHLLMEVLKLHNREKFKIHVYSYGPTMEGDEIQKKVISLVDVFHNVHNLSNNQIIKLCQKDHIDIAVDLTGFTKNNRFSLFASRLAPVQINYLGYPGTTGSKFMDYLISDKVVIPNDKKKYYSENIIYLPYSYQPNDNTKLISDKKFLRSEMNLPENTFIFCCFNDSYKISEVEFSIWMRLLKNVEESILWLLDTNRWARDNLKKEAKKRGIEPQRIVFAKKIKISDHLSRIRFADLFLDTFNYNAHTTASDALWSGLPILTKIGSSFSARVASSLLYAMDIPELVTKNQHDYERLALSLAKNPQKLLNIKNKILLNQKKSPLFDSNRYTKYLESGYLQAYKNYYKDNKHKTIHVSDDFYN